MAEETEKNVFNKELGIYQTAEEYKNRYNDVRDQWNSFGSDGVEWLTDDDGSLSLDYSQFGDNLTASERSEIADFERGNTPWEVITDHVKQLYADTIGTPVNNLLGKYNNLDEYYSQYSGVRDNWNQYGSNLVNFNNREGSSALDLDLSALGEFDKSLEYEITKFERGDLPWEYLSEAARNVYNSTVGTQTENLFGQYEDADDFLNRYSGVRDNWNRYGSDLDFVADDLGSLSLDYQGLNDGLTSDMRNEILEFERGNKGWSLLSGGVKTLYLSKFDPGEIIASYDENGEPVTVSDAHASDVVNYAPAPITPTDVTEAVVSPILGSGIDTDVQVWKDPVSAVNPGTAPLPVTTTIEYNAINTDQPVDENPPTYSSSPSATSSSNSWWGDGSPPAPPAEEPVGVTNINIPDAYDYTTYGLGKKADHVTTGYEPADVSGLYQEVGYEPQELAEGSQWVYDTIEGKWVQQPIGSNRGGKIRHYNEGDEVEAETVEDNDAVITNRQPLDYSGEGIAPALAAQLGELDKFYNDQTNLPTWYGTQWNPKTSEYDDINNEGQTVKQWIAAGGDPNEFQKQSPIAGFNDTQVGAQNALLDASTGQGNLAQNLADSVQTGLSGGYGYDPNLQIATTLGAAQGYDPSQAIASQQQGAFTYDPSLQTASQVQETATYSPAQYQSAQLNQATGYDPTLANAAQIGNANTYDAAQQGNANYINQYLDPAIQRAQEQAIGNVNSSFGSAGTLGSVRNASAASRAATEASLPLLNQAYGQEFAAQQAINSANQSATNAANQFGAQAGNQNAAINQAANQQTGLTNAAASNAADQYNAGVTNQFDIANVNAANTALQTNVANQNAAQQFGAAAANQAGFANQNALNAAAASNQASQNQAGVFGATANNQIQGANVGAQNQFALSNQAANNQAGQYNANNANQFANTNANILNNTDAANAQAANQASQYNLNNIGNWANQVANSQGALTQQGTTLAQIGQQQQDLAQNQTNQDVQAWNFFQQQNQQNLYNQLGLGQIAQAAQAGNIGADIEGAGGGFDWGSALNLGIQAAAGSIGGGIGDFISSLFNEGGKVNKVNRGLLGGRV